MKKKKEKKIFDGIRKPLAPPTKVFKDKKKQKSRDKKYKEDEDMWDDPWFDNEWKDFPKKSGWIDVPERKICRHPGHKAPNMLYIPQGKAYRHVCPGCGYTVILYGSNITW